MLSNINYSPCMICLHKFLCCGRVAENSELMCCFCWADSNVFPFPSLKGGLRIANWSASFFSFARFHLTRYVVCLLYGLEALSKSYKLWGTCILESRLQGLKPFMLIQCLYLLKCPRIWMLSSYLQSILKTEVCHITTLFWNYYFLYLLCSWNSDL